jgi:hypothetical protein
VTDEQEARGLGRGTGRKDAAVDVQDVALREFVPAGAVAEYQSRRAEEGDHQERYAEAEQESPHRH